MNDFNWVIIGAGELGSEIYHIFFKNSKRKLSYFVDDDKSKKKLLWKDIISFKNLLKLKKKINFVLAILDQKVRKIKIKKLSKFKNLIPQNLVHDQALMYNELQFEKGNIFYPYSNINYGSVIGNFNIFQFNSSIGHKTNFKNNNFIGSNSTISSDCKINSNVFIGANSNIMRGVKIKSGVYIAPSSLINKNIDKNLKVLTFPRLVFSKIKN